MRPTCAKLATGVLAFAAGRAAAAARSARRLLGRIGAENLIATAALFALCLAACAWPWLVLEVAAWTVGILLLILLLSAAPDLAAVLFILAFGGAVGTLILCWLS